MERGWDGTEEVGTTYTYRRAEYLHCSSYAIGVTLFTLIIYMYLRLLYYLNCHTIHKLLYHMFMYMYMYRGKQSLSLSFSLYYICVHVGKCFVCDTHVKIDILL